MSTFLLNILLAIAWIALTGEFTPENLGIGFVIGFALLWFGRRAVGAPNYASKVVKVLRFALFFLGQIIGANLRVAVVVLSLRPNIRPAVIEVPIEIKSELGITLLANLITLTPGTLYLDSTAEGRVMYIHTIYVDDVDAFRQHIKEDFEQPLMEILR